jgi:anti-anti-sigma factor
LLRTGDREVTVTQHGRRTLAVDDTSVRVGGESVRVLRVAGELDTATSDQLREGVAAAVGSVTAEGRPRPSGGPPLVVLDLDEVSFCDSRGLTSLLTAVSASARQGASLRFTARPPSAVQRLLARTGLDDLLPMHATLAEAVESVDTSRFEQEATGESPAS